MNNRDGRAARGQYAAGLIVAVAIAVVARISGQFLPQAIAEVTLALVLGIAIGQLPAASALAVGGRFATQRLLPIAIVLLGARLSLGQIGAIGAPAMILIVGTVSLAF